MPKLPGFDSQRQLTTQQPRFLRTGAGERNIYDIVGKTAGEIQDIGIKWSNALDTIQYTSAKANYESGVADIINRAENDISYNNSEQYYKELDNLKKSNLKGFANKAVEGRASIDFEFGNQAARIKIDNIYKKKAVEVGQVNTFRLLDLEKSNYINSLDEKGRLVSSTKMRNIVDAQVNAGIFGKKEGEEIYSDYIKEAQQVIKDEKDLQKKQEKEVMLAQDFAINEREDELVQLRVNMADPQGNPVTGIELIEKVRADMNDGLVSAEFGQAYINSLKSVKLADPTQLDSITKYNELVERNVALSKQEKAWFGMGKVPFEDIAKFRADVINANAEGFITNKQMTDLLSETSKTFYRDAVFQDALEQLAAQSSLYASKPEQARAKAEMYGSLMEKVIAGKNPQDAVQEVITEKLTSELGRISEKDEYGFEIGEIRDGYTYIGNNQWRKK